MTKVIVVGSLSLVEVENNTQQWTFKTPLQLFSGPKVSICVFRGVKINGK